jgi:hypothetical protein
MVAFTTGRVDQGWGSLFFAAFGFLCAFRALDNGRVFPDSNQFLPGRTYLTCAQGDTRSRRVGVVSTGIGVDPPGVLEGVEVAHLLVGPRHRGDAIVEILCGGRGHGSSVITPRRRAACVRDRPGRRSFAAKDLTSRVAGLLELGARAGVSLLVARTFHVFAKSPTSWVGVVPGDAVLRSSPGVQAVGVLVLNC